jgi:hypothetical protein
MCYTLLQKTKWNKKRSEEMFHVLHILMYYMRSTSNGSLPQLLSCVLYNWDGERGGDSGRIIFSKSQKGRKLEKYLKKSNVTLFS